MFAHSNAIGLQANQKFVIPKNLKLIGPETTLFKINQSRAARKWPDLTTMYGVIAEAVRTV